MENISVVVIIIIILIIKYEKLSYGLIVHIFAFYYTYILLCIQ